VITLLVVSVVILIVLHFGGRWVRERCREIDFGLFGPRDTPARSS
jgi:hypothetical protein